MHIKKRGFFFILDAVLGLFILVVGVFLVTSSYITAPQQAQVALLSDDFLNYLSNTKIRDLNNPYAGIGGELWSKGIIEDADNTLLQQIGELYARSELNISDKFIQNVSKEIIPPQYLYEVWINKFMVYPQNATSSHNLSKANTKLLLVSKKITFGVLNRTTSTMWGPYQAEVFTWQR